jgi:hypothetical protein
MTQIPGDILFKHRFPEDSGIGNPKSKTFRPKDPLD